LQENTEGDLEEGVEGSGRLLRTGLDQASFPGVEQEPSRRIRIEPSPDGPGLLRLCQRAADQVGPPL
jgi:hypothetical protein